jgi:hypothetical protein
MKKLLPILLLMLCGRAIAADVYLQGAVVYGLLSSSQIQWANTNNNYIIDTISPGTGVCFGVTNFDSGSHTATVTAFITQDQHSTTFTGNSQNWLQVAVTPTPTITGGTTSYTFPATATTQLYVRAAGASHVALVISGATGTGLMIVRYTQTGSPCGSVFSWTVTDAGGPSCNRSNGIVPAVPGVRHVASAVTFALTNTNATGGSIETGVDVRDGGAANGCATGSVIYSNILGIESVTGSTDHMQLSGLNAAGTPGNALQICFEQTMPTGDVCRTSMSGYDTQ